MHNEKKKTTNDELVSILDAQREEKNKRKARNDKIVIKRNSTTTVTAIQLTNPIKRNTSIETSPIILSIF